MNVNIEERDKFGFIPPYPSLAVTRDLEPFLNSYIKAKCSQSTKKTPQVKTRDPEMDNERKMGILNPPTADEIVKHGRKGAMSAKRTRGYLTNAENPQDAHFWKSRGVGSLLNRDNVYSAPLIRNKSRLQSSSGIRSNAKAKSRPNTSKYERVTTNSGIYRRNTDSRLEYQMNYDVDPDTVHPSHLLDVLVSENVSFPAIANSLGDNYNYHTHATVVRPKTVELQLKRNHSDPNGKSLQCPMCFANSYKRIPDSKYGFQTDNDRGERKQSRNFGQVLNSLQQSRSYNLGMGLSKEKNKSHAKNNTNYVDDSDKLSERLTETVDGSVVSENNEKPPMFVEIRNLPNKSTATLQYNTKNASSRNSSAAVCLNHDFTCDIEVGQKYSRRYFQRQNPMGTLHKKLPVPCNTPQFS